MLRKKLQIFISSTYLDLKEERQAAVSAILKAGHIPAGMELFTSGDESQWDTITRWIDESDIYMLILGGRYGSTHPVTGQGYTEMEYDYAVAAGKPYFSVIINNSTLDSWVKERGKEVLELKHPDKLEKFRAKVLGRTSSFFDDAKDIKLSVHETIPNLEQKHNPLGWISGSEFTDNKPLIDELAKLGEENRLLRKEVSQLQNALDKTKAKQGDGDLTELKDVLSKIEIDVTEFKNEVLNIPSKISLLNLAFYSKESLASGVSNQWGATKFESFLFNDICPRLSIYEVVQIEKVAGATWRRFSLTSKGKRLLAELDKDRIDKKQKALSKKPNSPESHS